ncbi:hypothetical protein N7466_003658 [Penicillium verhagenii]|uniref:uncharacterized protein n=1 Tax=Penicillium verhagenii TaxID=1562060 RepID=UPI0025458B1D|nr:uncharacterized protein N7466_003658 [Penicillium verhagenii]KAJ5934111.1 hypothetical protein N7466_003658 [Penicillium verhagenii]
MRSMNLPMGNIDPRVMIQSDPSVDALFSPSFASVLAFDEPDEQGFQDLPALDEEYHCEHNMDWQGQPAPSSTRESSLQQGSVKRSPYPRLELDVAMDRYHALDGPAELLIPHNTPESAHGSPREERRGHKAENLRTHSAPQPPVLTLDWLEDRRQAKRHRLFISDESRSPSPNMQGGAYFPNVNFTSIEDFGETVATRCVRFSPPESPRSGSRPLPSVERKQDYISHYRQQKQHEKWKVARRASPRRSPAKVQLSTGLDAKPEVRFSGLSRMIFRQDDLATSPKSKHRVQAAKTSQSILRDIHEEALPRERVPAVIALNFGLYRPRDPGPITSVSKWALMRVRMSHGLVPVHSLFGEPQGPKQIVCPLPSEDLLLHFIIVLPYLVVRIPLTALAKAGRFPTSRASLTTLDIFRIIWALTFALVTFVFHQLWSLKPGPSVKAETQHHEKARRL